MGCILNMEPDMKSSFNAPSPMLIAPSGQSGSHGVLGVSKESPVNQEKTRKKSKCHIVLQFSEHEDGTILCDEISDCDTTFQDKGADEFTFYWSRVFDSIIKPMAWWNSSKEKTKISDDVPVKTKGYLVIDFSENKDGTIQMDSIYDCEADFHSEEEVEVEYVAYWKRVQEALLIQEVKS